jgi:hypothetical protein
MSNKQTFNTENFCRICVNRVYDYYNGEWYCMEMAKMNKNKTNLESFTSSEVKDRR